LTYFKKFPKQNSFFIPLLAHPCYRTGPSYSRFFKK
jgi:hypothetical protein